MKSALLGVVEKKQDKNKYANESGCLHIYVPNI